MLDWHLIQGKPADFRCYDGNPHVGNPHVGKPRVGNPHVGNSVLNEWKQIEFIRLFEKSVPC